MRRPILAFLLAVVTVGASARAEGPRRMTLDEAVATALANHPRLRASHAAERAADARADEATARELPSLGVSAEINRSTGNTQPGAFFPAAGFPPVAGDLVEVLGDVHEGDLIAKRGSEEMRAGSKVQLKVATGDVK